MCTFCLTLPSRGARLLWIKHCSAARPVGRVCIGVLVAASLAQHILAQRPLTWQEVRDKFETTNPTLRAGQIGIDESKAQEVTAYLRPNPDVTAAIDQINPFAT